MADFLIEQGYIIRGYQSVAGVDEAGRGSLFGPVVAAAVMFSPETICNPRDEWLAEIQDSKLLSILKRKRLFDKILANADSIGFGMASHAEIDHKNIYWASLAAMNRAVCNMSKSPEFLLVDGFPIKETPLPQLPLKKGDRISTSIAAASILAKVFRDSIICHMDVLFKGYNLADNKGYGTARHHEALQKQGPSPLHRQSYRPVRESLK